jgi:hypothetical protein
MRAIGAKYYRVSVTETNSSGNPAGSPEYIIRGLSWNKAVSTSDGNDLDFSRCHDNAAFALDIGP